MSAMNLLARSLNSALGPLLAPRRPPFTAAAALSAPSAIPSGTANDSTILPDSSMKARSAPITSGPCRPLSAALEAVQRCLLLRRELLSSALFRLCGRGS